MSRQCARVRLVAVSAVLWIGLAALAPNPGLAQPPDGHSEEDWAAAQALFDQGVRLLDAGNTREACDKFEASLRRVDGLGTRGKLAECYERLGRTASAWRLYSEILEVAIARGDRVRERVARERTARLLPRLPYVLVAFRPATRDAVVLTDNGAPVAPADWGTPRAVDPGPHEIALRVHGRVRWSATVTARESSSVTIEVPWPPGDQAGRDGTPGAADALLPPSEGRLGAGDEGRGRRRLGIALAALGAAGAVASGVLSVSAYTDWKDVEPLCPDNLCVNEAAQAQAEAAKVKANAATISIAAGLTLATVGAILWWTGRANDEPDGISVSASRTSIGVWASGRF